jgi:Protein of unknown function (DUF4089)
MASRGGVEGGWRRLSAPTLYKHQQNETSVMTEHPFDASAIIDAMAPLLGISIGEASRDSVKTHLEIAARYAALLEESELGDHEEPAPVFTP